jgi:hypothetical protein
VIKSGSGNGIKIFCTICVEVLEYSMMGISLPSHRKLISKQSLVFIGHRSR